MKPLDHLEAGRQSTTSTLCSSYFTWLVVITLLSFSAPATAQSRILDSLEFTGGLSSIDRYTLGARYRFGQNNIGFTIGTFHDFYGSYTNALVFSLTYNRHLFGRSRFTHQKPWFMRSSIGYYNGRATELTYAPSLHRVTFGRLYVGRDFNFSPRCGVSLSAILNMNIHSYHDDKTDRNYRSMIFTPGIDALFFYRLKGKKP